MLTFTQVKTSHKMKILQRSLPRQRPLFHRLRAGYVIASLIIGFAVKQEMQILHHQHGLLT